VTDPQDQLQGARPDGRIDPYLPYRRTLLPAQRVRELSRRRPARAIRDTAICWAIIVGAWAGAASIGTWWAIAIAGVLVGNRFYALFIIGHDGMHRRLFEKGTINDLFADAFVYAPIGAINRINSRNHLLHHQYLATEDDPDRHKHTCFNKATVPLLASYLTAVSSVVRSLGHVFFPHSSASGRATRAPRPSYRLRDIALLVGWQLVLFGVLTWLLGWWAYLALWWAPVFVFMFLADNLRTFVEHSQPEADQSADSHRLVTNVPGWLERQLLAPMNMNYHAAHHLWPSIPYYNLPVADAEMRRAPGADAISWRGSYLGYVWRYSRVLPLAECRENPAHG
jgi:fatty acid desaturase